MNKRNNPLFLNQPCIRFGYAQTIKRGGKNETIYLNYLYFGNPWACSPDGSCSGQDGKIHLWNRKFAEGLQHGCHVQMAKGNESRFKR